MTCSPRQEPAVLLLGLLGGGEAASIDAGGGRSGDDPIICFADSTGCSQGSGGRDSSRIRLGIIATPRA